MQHAKCAYKYPCFFCTDLFSTYRQFEKWLEEKSRVVTGTPVNSEMLTLLAIAVLHLVVQGTHGYRSVGLN